MTKTTIKAALVKASGRPHLALEVAGGQRLTIDVSGAAGEGLLRLLAAAVGADRVLKALGGVDALVVDGVPVRQLAEAWKNAHAAMMASQHVGPVSIAGPVEVTIAAPLQLAPTEKTVEYTGHGRVSRVTERPLAPPRSAF